MYQLLIQDKTLRARVKFFFLICRHESRPCGCDLFRFGRYRGYSRRPPPSHLSGCCGGFLSDKPNAVSSVSLSCRVRTQHQLSLTVKESCDESKTHADVTFRFRRRSLLKILSFSVQFLVHFSAALGHVIHYWRTNESVHGRFTSEVNSPSVSAFLHESWSRTIVALQDNAFLRLVLAEQIHTAAGWQ